MIRIKPDSVASFWQRDSPVEISSTPSGRFFEGRSRFDAEPRVVRKLLGGVSGHREKSPFFNGI